MTVLFASYNNVPINNVFEKLSSLTYKGKRVAFPVLRLGNQESKRMYLLHQPAAERGAGH